MSTETDPRNADPIAEDLDSAREQALLEQQIRRRTFFSFSFFALAEIGGVASWLWYRSRPKTDHSLTRQTRSLLEGHEKFNKAILSDHSQAKSFPSSLAVTDPRLNGDIGMDDTFEPEDWKLELVDPSTGKSRHLDLTAIKSLPRRRLIFDFKCIEGWDQVVDYSGTRFSDFLIDQKLGTLPGREADPEKPDNWYSYVGLETPDGKYFVGMDIKSILHPQTLLCYMQKGKELEYDHGAPLRLVTPIKYGVKNLKRIGKIFFSNKKPKDYWYNEGYPYDLTL